MQYVLFYETAAGAADKIPDHFPAHREHWQGFLDRGELLAIGPFTDRTGAMAVFTTRGAAEAFAEADPFVVNGVVGNWSIREWMEAISDSGH